MRQAKYIPASTFHRQQDSQAPVRKRNYSLGTKPHSEREPLPLLTKQTPSVATYRRYRLQAKIQKFKNMKAGTKLCQESINNYINLKQQITSKRLDPEIVVTPKKDPKLFVKNLDIDCRNHIKIREFKPASKQRSKTEGNNLIQQRRAIQNETGLRMKAISKTRSRQSSTSQSKKYNDLSLKERVDTQDEPIRYSMLVKLSEIVGRKDAIEVSNRKQSDDYELQGWSNIQMLEIL